jgi:hypothetical protein
MLEPNKGAKMSKPEVNNEAKKEFHKDLFNFHNDMEALKKEANNPFHKSKYLKLAPMLGAVRPIAKKHNFILSQPTDVTNGPNGLQNVVFSILTHVPTGLSETAKLAIPDDIKDPQRVLAAVTYYRRGTLSALLGLIEEDDDGNFASGKVAPKSKVSSKDHF